MVLEPRTLEERRRPPSGGRLGDSRAWKGSQLIPGGTALDQVVATLVKNVQDGADLMASTDQFVVDSDVDKIRVPYQMYDGTSEE